MKDKYDVHQKMHILLYNEIDREVDSDEIRI